jgi:hypothetical protein
MKNTIRLVLVLVVGVMVAGCVSIPSANASATKFEGAWKNHAAPVNLIYAFKGNTWKLTVDKLIRTGTFIFDDTYITFTFRDKNREDSWTQKYTLESNILWLEKEPNPDPRRLFGHMYGSFKRR